MQDQQPVNEELLLEQPADNSPEKNLAVETPERTRQLNEIRELPWNKRLIRAISKGSMRGAVIIFLRLSLGAGIFTLPHYVSCYGYILGAVFITAASLINVNSYYDIIEAAEESKSTNYFDFVNDYLGPTMLKIFKFTYLIDLSATVIGVLVICYNLFQFCMGFMGFTKPEWYEDIETGKWNESYPEVVKWRGIFISAIIFLSIYFLLKKDLFMLQNVNYCVMLALAALVIWSIGEMGFFWNAYSETSTRHAFQGFHDDWFENVFALMLAFYAQPYVFTLKNEIIYPTVKRMKKTTWITMMIETSLFVLVGTLGYLAYGDKFTPEVFYARKPYPGKSEVSEWIYRGLLMIFFGCVVTGLAVYNPTIREAIYDLFQVNPKNKLYYVLISIVPYVFYGLIAFAKPSIVFIFNFAGVTVSNLNGFIIPALISAKRNKAKENWKGMAWAIGRVIFFVVFGGLGLYFMVSRLI